jgi:hypothetical protein
LFFRISLIQYKCRESAARAIFIEGRMRVDVEEGAVTE